jgi:adenosylmethionine-8-amino-7-oxononanoate aminotransferase
MSDIAWPFIPGPTLDIVGASGVYLYTADGKRILDAAGGAIVTNIGHGRERVVERVAEATRDYTYVVPPWITPSRRALVTALQKDWLPPELCHIHATSGGSESVESAVKIALQYHAARGEPERCVVIARSPSYHGTTLATASLSGHAARKRGLEAALTAGPERVAAFLAEPITGSSGGALVPPDDYWPRVRKICDRHGVLLIMDEVMTGFGRTGTRFGYQHWDLTPDILVGGKGLAGGYAPLGGVFATAGIGDAIAAAGLNVMFHTFGAHPAACAAGAEVLTILEEEGLTERAGVMGAELKERLEARLGQHPHVAEVRGRGLLLAVEIVRDRDSLTPYPETDNMASRIVAHGLDQGVFFYGGGTGEIRDIVCLGPPLIIEEEHVAQMVDVLAGAIDQVCA